MKKFIAFSILIITVVMTAAAQEVAPVVEQAPGVGDFLKQYAFELITAFLVFVKVVVNLTPTDKDNKVFAVLDNLINWIVPNLKKGGGKF